MKFWKFWNCLQIEVGIFPTSFCEGKIWNFDLQKIEILIIRKFENLKFRNSEIIIFIFFFENFYNFLYLFFSLLCLKFWPVSSSVWPGSPAGPSRETGLEAEIPDLGTEDELEVGTKKFGGFSPPGSTMDIEILGEIDRIRAKLCGNAPGWLAGWLGWLGWLAGCGLKSTILLKDQRKWKKRERLQNNELRIGIERY